MTPQEFADYLETVKGRIIALISNELVPGQTSPGERLPKVINRLVVERNRDTWAAKLRSKRHVETVNTVSQEMVHAFMIGYGGLGTYEDRTVRSVAYRLRFTVDSYYQDSPGTDEDSPEKRHGAEIARVAHVLLTTRPFGVEGVKEVTGFNERRGLSRLGNVIVRESLGEMFVTLKPIQIPA